jgi:hypothetical protein
VTPHEDRKIDRMQRRARRDIRRSEKH